MKLNQTK